MHIHAHTCIHTIQYNTLPVAMRASVYFLYLITLFRMLGLVFCIMYVVSTAGQVENANNAPSVSDNSDKTHLRKSSKTMAALRKVVMDKQWLRNFSFYVRFRQVYYVWLEKKHHT